MGGVRDQLADQFRFEAEHVDAKLWHDLSVFTTIRSAAVAN